jgi:hypothetical protein
MNGAELVKLCIDEPVRVLTTSLEGANGVPDPEAGGANPPDAAASAARQFPIVELDTAS